MMRRARTPSAARPGILRRDGAAFLRPASSVACVRDDGPPRRPPRLRPAAPPSAPSDAAPHPRYPNLFSPLKISPHHTLRNRIVMGSMHCGLEGHSIPKPLLPLFAPPSSSSSSSHDSLEALAEYFAERARGEAALMVTGGIAPNRRGWVSPFAAKLSTATEAERHRVVTAAVRAASPRPGPRTRLCLQILHAGRYAYHPFGCAPSAVRAAINPFVPREMSGAEVLETIEDYANCAALAQEAGYDGAEIMASEGYLINQFLAAKTNRRTDAWGGPEFRERMRFAVEVVRRVRERTSPEFIVIFRLSMLDLVEGGSSWEEVATLAQAVEDAGATILNTGVGWHESRVPTIATSVPRGGFAWVTRKLKEENRVSLPLVATNRLNGPGVMERVLATGCSDLVSAARPFLADAAFPKKAREGREAAINTCIGCNQACLDHAFVGKTASCLVNPRACRETEFPEGAAVAPGRRKRVAVAGAGMAGLAFATTAAERGHEVTLFDSADEIGGQFNMAKRIPGKEEFHETIRYFRDRLSSLPNLTLRLGRAAALEDWVETGEDGDGPATPLYDRFVVATGVVPRIPDIKGIDHPNVVTYVDVLKHRVPVGRNVAIIGAGGIGFDVAEYLLHHDPDREDLGPDDVDVDAFLKRWNVDRRNRTRGGLLPGTPPDPPPRRNVTLLQRKRGKLGAGLGRTTGWIHRTTLRRSGVRMLDGCVYDRVDDDGTLRLADRDGRSLALADVDTVVVCAGQTSLRTLKDRLDDAGFADRSFCVGGAHEAGELDAKRAVDMGMRLAYVIGDDRPEIPVSEVTHEEVMMGMIGKLVR